MSEMIWCNSCKTVVWAFDHQPKVDMRGICNMLCLPCPKCGDKGNYDGWGIDELTEAMVTQLNRTSGMPIYDRWAAMKAVAKLHNVVWEPSPDNDWFRRP
jgi:hypothetical protein